MTFARLNGYGNLSLKPEYSVQGGNRIVCYHVTKVELKQESWLTITVHETADGLRRVLLSFGETIERVPTLQSDGLCNK